MNQGPARQIRAHRKNQGPAGQIRAKCDEPGPSRTKQEPPRRTFKFLIFAKVKLSPLQKIVGQIRGVFSFWGTIGMAPHQVGPTQKKILRPPLNRSGSLPKLTRWLLPKRNCCQSGLQDIHLPEWIPAEAVKTDPSKQKY